jgi:hypothetical protein
MIEKIKQLFKQKNYSLFENDSKPFNLNIIGIRNLDKVNSFDDTLLVTWKYNNKWSELQFSITTEPGLYWLQNPENNKGTAILKEGQYKGLWELGLHKGKYKALVQKSSCTVLRDSNKDDKFDTDKVVEDTGLFGINCHRANEKQESTQVEKWSAGCQVFANPFEFELFINICEQSINNSKFNNSFTYTLINIKDIQGI